MAGEQWISGLVWHRNIMINQYLPRAISFVFTLISVCLIAHSLTASETGHVLSVAYLLFISLTAIGHLAHSDCCIGYWIVDTTLGGLAVVDGHVH